MAKGLRNLRPKQSETRGEEASRQAVPAALPAFCDYLCPHASFAPADAAGACRREQAIFCSLLRKFNNKNNRCLAKTA